jgi:lipoprotein NlpD
MPGTKDRGEDRCVMNSDLRDVPADGPFLPAPAAVARQPLVQPTRSLRARWMVLAAAAVLAACATSDQRAPVGEPRLRPPEGTVVQPVTPPVVPPGTQVAVEPTPTTPLPPGAEHAGKPGYYTIRPGDTLLRIAMDSGQNWRDIARWNQLANPNVIEVGQVLRVVPPNGVASSAAVAQPGHVQGRPLEGAPAVTAPVQVGALSGGDAQRVGDENVAWMWPASGAVLMGFDDVRSKGLAIAGNAGDPVFAAADGRVVYAGSGLRGYGNLVIVKHNNTYLTAYAHNQALLVREDQVVRRGEQIAEMGSTDAERVQLHFEIRRQGRPVDPARLLPPR